MVNNLPIPSLKVNSMSGMKALVGKKVLKEVTFMGEPLKIQKLSLGDVTAIQELAKAAEASKDENASMNVMKLVVRSGAEGAADLTDEDFLTFALDDLSELSASIMDYSGVGKAKDEEAGN
jgi:hypothetical protein